MGHTSEIERGERFEFGRNWSAFLRHLDDERIAEAERSLRTKLQIDRLDGKRFLDIGSGSGLFSLAARRLGASVRSFDYDPHSVACTTELRRRYFPDDPHWEISQGSVLDRAFVEGLGTHDVVYAWGVLHHTGDMWTALEYATLPVAPGGRLWIAIYNDQGPTSRRWTTIKRVYNRGGPLVRGALVGTIGGVIIAGSAAKHLLRLQNPLRAITGYKQQRGMSRWHDIVDWVGGYPFEVAKPEEIFEFFAKRGFLLEHMKTCGGDGGCNEFVFRRA